MTTGGKENLTREEARARAVLISSPTYEIALDINPSVETVGCDTTIKFGCSQPGASTFIDLDASSVHSIELNGSKVDVGEAREGRVPIGGLEADNVLRIRADMAYSHTGTGIQRVTDPIDGRTYAYTNCEPFDAHRVFPCFDQPDIKGTFAFEVTVPEGDIVVSNTKPTNGGTRWTFDPSPVMSTYLAAVCAGPYHGVHDKYENIDLGWYCRQSFAEHLDPDELFLLTKQGLEFFGEIFDYPYMLDTYDQVFCPEYKIGAMENFGCVTYTERYIFRSKVTEAERERRASTILHEMSHMWFGDLVTMRWWDGLWLNESFATYMASLAQERATRFKSSWVSFATDEKTAAYRQDQLPTTHPIVADIPDVEATHLNFDMITYAKGASVLKQLVAYVGEEAFTKGLRRYFRTHEWGNTELTDFLSPLSDESGRDLVAWSKEWLETTGVNATHVAYETESDAITSFEVVQTGETPPRSHRMSVGLFDATGAGVQLRRALELDVSGERTPVPDFVGEKVPDLVLPNHEDLAYTKIRFDDRSLATVTQRLKDIDDPLARSLCWSAAWEMMRDAQLPATGYVDLVINNAGAETDVYAMRGLLRRCSGASDHMGPSASAIRIYADPGNRETLREKFGKTAHEELMAAAPGSDLQLTWAREFIGSARSPDTDLVRGLLDGTASIDGLAVDTDLRWHIVLSLTSSGEAGAELVDTELEHDPSDQGRRIADCGRAGIPTKEAKAQAWERVLHDDDLTLNTLRAISHGFQHPEQSDLIADYLGPYFDELLGFWVRREIDLGFAYINGMYPRLYNEDVVAATDRFLSDASVPKPIRRCLIERKDETQRAIRARAADAAVARP